MPNCPQVSTSMNPVASASGPPRKRQAVPTVGGGLEVRLGLEIRLRDHDRFSDRTIFCLRIGNLQVRFIGFSRDGGHGGRSGALPDAKACSVLVLDESESDGTQKCPAKGFDL